MKCRPWKAWFWCPLPSENAVATFPDLLEMSSTWYPNGLQIGAGGCLWDQKVGKSGFGKHNKKTSQKNIEICSNRFKKRVPKKWYLCGFSGFHPSMVSRASLGRLPGSKARQNGGPDMDFLRFHVFHELQIASTRSAVDSLPTLLLQWFLAVISLMMIPPPWFLVMDFLSMILQKFGVSCLGHRLHDSWFWFMV